MLPDKSRVLLKQTYIACGSFACPVWVKGGHTAMPGAGPLQSQQRTLHQRLVEPVGVLDRKRHAEAQRATI
jgi:hypothetical protein